MNELLQLRLKRATINGCSNTNTEKYRDIIKKHCNYAELFSIVLLIVHQARKLTVAVQLMISSFGIHTKRFQRDLFG